MWPLTGLMTVRPAQRFLLHSLGMQWRRQNQDQKADREKNKNSAHANPKDVQRAYNALAITLRIGNLSYRNATATPASTTGSDQAQSPSHETATAPSMHPVQKPTMSSEVFFSRSLACAGHGESQESELARHRGDSDHGGDAGHQSVPIRAGIIDDAVNQNAGEQQKVKQEQGPGQGWTASFGHFGDQPNDGDGDDEDGNGQDQGHVGWSAAHQHSRYHYQVAGDMGGEYAEAQITDHVDHARDHAQQRRNPPVQWRPIGSVI